MSKVSEIINNIRKGLASQKHYSVLDQYLNELEEHIKDDYLSVEQVNNRVEQYNEIILEYAQNKYNRSASIIYDAQNYLDALGVSINMLGEELNYSTITKHYLQDIFDSMEDILVVVDSGGYILSVNESATRKIGYTADELKQLQVLSIFKTEHDNFQSFINQHKKGDVYKIKSKNKLINTILSISPFVRGDNDAVGTVIIAKDISLMLEYQQRIEKQNGQLIKAIKKAEESDRLKSIFLANVSHEIRTPLNSILGFSEILSRNPDADLSSRIQYLSFIKSSGNHLLDVINDIIDISKIESNQIRIDLRVINLNQLMDEVYDVTVSNQYLIEKENLSLHYKYGLDHEESSIYADPSRLKQVLLNLVNNAIKFTHEGSIEFGYYLKEKRIVFYVKDTGIGIDRNDFKEIFVPFKQVDNSSTREFQGTGLGLSICKALVEKMGGQMKIDSEIGQGSIFTFDIEYRKSEVNSEILNPIASSISEDLDLSHINVLIVEDNTQNYLYLKQILEQYKANIKHCIKGIDAINIAEANKGFDIVLLDINLPDINGYMVMQQIKKIYPKLPIIAVTANAMSDDKTKVLEAGFDGYVSKPLDRIKLLNYIIEFTTCKS